MKRNAFDMGLAIPGVRSSIEASVSTLIASRTWRYSKTSDFAVLDHLDQLQLLQGQKYSNFKSIIMTNGVLLLALFALALSADIQRVAELQTETVFAQSFPSLTFKTEVSNSSGPGRSEIAKIISNWFTSFREDSPTDRAFPTEPNKAGSKSCDTQPYIFKQALRLMTRVNFDASALQVGSLLQMVDPTNFARGIVPAFLPENKRNPLQVVVSNGISATFNATVQTMTSQLNEALLKNIQTLNSQPIQLYLQKTTEVEKYLRNIGLSSAVYEELQIGARSADRIRNSNRKQVIVLFQKLFSTALDFSNPEGKPLPSLVENVYSPIYTMDEFMQACSYGYWKTGNLPHLVTQANYGRMLVLSVDDEPNIQKLVVKLTALFADGKRASIAELDEVLAEVQKLPTLRYYIGGINPVFAFQRVNSLDYYRETVNWKKVFYDFTDPRSIQLLRPLSAKAYNLFGKAYSQVQTRYFPVKNCPAQPVVQIQIRQVRQECKIYLKKSGDKDFNRLILTARGQQRLDIGGSVGWQSFQLKVVLKGRKNSGFKIRFWQNTNYNQHLKMTIKVGEKQRNIEHGNSRAKTEYMDLFFTVDPVRQLIA